MYAEYVKRIDTFLYILLGVIVGILICKLDFSVLTSKFATSSCIYKGQTYKHGEGFKDDCNSCSCQNGQIACTLMACAAPDIQPRGKPYIGE